MTRDLSDLMAPDWADALAPVADDITAAGRFLREEIAAGRSYLPPGDRILRAFAEPMADVRVLITGQDPYPTPGHPVGLSFSVAPDVRPLPRSLVNIYAELEADLGIEPCPHGDLTAWVPLTTAFTLPIGCCVLAGMLAPRTLRPEKRKVP